MAVRKMGVKRRKATGMELLFVILLIIGALGIQYGNGWLSKNEFGAVNFLMILPLLIIAQYFIAWGYHDGTVNSGFVTAFIVWTSVSVLATLAINYILFQNTPGPITIFALVLCAISAIVAMMGK